MRSAWNIRRKKNTTSKTEIAYNHRMFSYDITARAGRARTGIFHTPHGDLETPVFAPVETQASVSCYNFVNGTTQ
jgi:hypothetical protein